MIRLTILIPCQQSRVVTVVAMYVCCCTFGHFSTTSGEEEEIDVHRLLRNEDRGEKKKKAKNPILTYICMCLHYVINLTAPPPPSL